MTLTRIELNQEHDIMLLKKNPTASCSFACNTQADSHISYSHHPDYVHFHNSGCPLVVEADKIQQQQQQHGIKFA